MGCCGQNPVGSGAVAVDTCKRVNYTLGMLLGVDDFVQEAAYNTARRHQLARGVLGYGTVRGLDVVVDPNGDNGPRLRVAPGLAVLPSGALVCVDAEQCCGLNDWLAARATLVAQALKADAPTANIVLHVVLSYAPCLTDEVAIPGEPCRSEDELMQPSRVADGFSLELRLDAPPQREEDAIRDFVDWLGSIPVITGSPSVDEKHFIDQLRDAAHAWLEPTSPPAIPSDFMFGAPVGDLRANEDLLRAALRLWTTELRPLWMARVGCGCGAQQPAGVDDAVLLATLDVPLVATGGSGGWRVSSAAEDAVGIDASRRPVLLSLRMVQELITQNPTPEAGDAVVPATAFGLLPEAGSEAAYSRTDHSHGTPELPLLSGDLQGLLDDAGATSPPQPPQVVGLRGRPLADVLPTVGQVLLFGADGWAPGNITGSVPGTLPDLSGDLSGSLDDAGATSPPRPPQVVGLRGQPLADVLPTVGQVLLFGASGWVPGNVPVNVPDPIPNLSGDLSGKLGGTGAAEPRIAGLQGHPVDAAAPKPDDVLRFVGGTWVPAALPATAGDFVGRNVGEYEIVAAGEIEANLNNGAVSPAALSSYGGLKPRRGPTGDTNSHAVIEFVATVPNAETIPFYVVKLTAIWTEGSRLEFRLYLLETVKASGNTINFNVMLSADSQIVDGDFRFRFQVEVSRFGAS